MAIKLVIFGQLVDVIGTDHLEIEDISDTQSLEQELISRYPQLKGATYRIALDKKLLTENTVLKKDSLVALLPPFSGG